MHKVTTIILSDKQKQWHIQQYILTLTVLITTIDALGHFETG